MHVRCEMNYNFLRYYTMKSKMFAGDGDVTEQDLKILKIV